MKTTKCLLLLLIYLSCITVNAAKDPNEVTDREKKKMTRNRLYGKYNQGLLYKSFPYTTFNKSAGGWSLAQNIEDIKKNVSYGHPRQVYEDLLSEALKEVPLPGGEGFDDGHTSQAAMRAKNAAFIFLLNFDSDGNALGNRNRYRDSAIKMLKRATIDVQRVNDRESYVRRSKELILYLQAYDLLVTASMHTNGTVSSGDILDIRLRLQKFARNIYRKSKSVFLITSSNQSLCGAAALGLAAIVLKDCGYTKFKKNWHPSAWAKKAHKEESKALYDADFLWWEAMTQRGVDAGYAEGPHYLDFAMENLMVFWRANANMYDLALDDNKIKLVDWYVRILQPNGTETSLDATQAYNQFPYWVAIADYGKYMIANPKSVGQSDLRADYLASTLTYKKQTNVPCYANEASGDLVLRNDLDTLDINCHYIHISGERGTAVNGGGHVSSPKS